MDRCPVHGTEITTGGCVTCRQIGPRFDIRPVSTGDLALESTIELRTRVAALEDLVREIHARILRLEGSR